MTDEFITEKRAKEIFVTRKEFDAALDLKVDKGTIMWGVGIMIGVITSAIVASTAFTYAQLAKVEANVRANNDNIIEIRTDVNWIKTTLDKYDISID